MKILLDTSVLKHSEIGCLRVSIDSDIQGPLSQGSRILRSYLKPARPVSEEWLTLQIASLKDFGEALRNKTVCGYIYGEIDCELMRGYMSSSTSPTLDLLYGVEIDQVEPAIERSRFQQVPDFMSKSRQFSFLTWLLSQTKAKATRLASLNGLTTTSSQSFRSLDMFQMLCTNMNKEHLPDAFHYWTAHQNSLDAYVTLDRKFLRLVSGKTSIFAPCRAISPLDCLYNLPHA